MIIHLVIHPMLIQEYPTFHPVMVVHDSRPLHGVVVLGLCMHLQGSREGLVGPLSRGLDLTAHWTSNEIKPKLLNRLTEA